MAFEYSFKLNGNELYATLGANTIDKLEEAMDETAFHIPITVLDYEYKMFGLLQVSIKDENEDELTFDYLIMSDEVSVLSKDGWYSHNLTAIEYTHKLDKYLVNTLTFTKPFSRKVRAPFDFLLGFDIVTPKTYMDAILPKIDIMEFYTVNEKVVFNSVGYAKYADPLYGSANSEFFDKDVYIRVDNETYHNLTNSNFEYTFTTSGYRTITIGVIIDESDPFNVELLPVYKYYITVFGDKKYTLYDVLTIIRSTTPIESRFYQDYSGLKLFDIDENLVDEFKKIEMPQLFIQHQTLRQVLNTIFKYINAISRLKYVDNDVDILTVDKFNKITGDLFITDEIDFTSSQDIQNYATKAISWLDNSLQDNFRENPSIKTPATSKFKTVRASQIKLINTPGYFHLKLERPIYELSKLEVILPKITRGGITYTNRVIDITPRVIEKKWWELKDIDVNFPTYTPTSAFHSQLGRRSRRGGNIFWERNKDSIDFSFRIGDYIQSTLIVEVIQEALNEEITLEPEIKQTGDLIDFSFQTSTYIIDDIDDTNVFRNIGFNVEYITLENPTHQAERLDITSINYNSELKVNQTSRQTDFNRASRNAFGQLQRSGIPNIVFTKVHTSISEIYDLGMMNDDGYVLTQRSLSLFNEHIQASYTLTLDHNRLNEFNGINQEYRVFEVPQSNSVYNRRDLYVDYLIVYNPINYEDFNFTGSPTYLNEAGVERTILKLRNNYKDNTKITYSFVKTDTFNNENPSGAINNFALMTPVISYGGQNALVFNIGFDDNILAGVGLYKDSAGNIYNYPIKYTDDRGFFDELWFGMGSTYSQTDIFELDPNGPLTGEDYFNKEVSYPLIKDGDNVSLGQTFYIDAGYSTDADDSYNPLICYKDASSNYHLSYQVSIIPFDFKEYIMGQYFFTNNPLVNNMDENDYLYLYKYTDGTKYRKFDDLLLLDGAYESPVLLSTTNTSYVDGVFTFLGDAVISNTLHTSWAIADKYGNLYMACNKRFNGFKFVLRHIRPNMLIIGNKALPPEVVSIKDSIHSFMMFSSNGSGYKGTVLSGSIQDEIMFESSGLGYKGTTYLVSVDDKIMFESSGLGFEGTLYTIQINDSILFSKNGLGYKGTIYTDSAYGLVNFNASANGDKMITYSDSVYDTVMFNASASGTTTLDRVVNVSDYIMFNASASGSVEAYTYHTVYFLDHDGTTLKTVTDIPYDGYASPPSNPSRVGYTFDGWDSSAYQVVTQNETITATYGANKYILYLNENGGSAVANKTVTYDSAIGTISTPTNSPHQLVGWFDTSATEGGNEYTASTVYQIAGNSTIWARWTYTLTFNANGGTVSPTSREHEHDEVIGTLPIPTRANYTFVEWQYNGKTFTATKQMPDMNITIDAVWTSNATVGWVAGGTTPTTYQTCVDIDDVNNVRCDVTCSWVYYDGPFLSMQDDSTNPQCSGGATRTVCTKSGGTFWQCYVEEGKITYTNCETCEVL